MRLLILVDGKNVGRSQSEIPEAAGIGPVEISNFVQRHLRSLDFDAVSSCCIKYYLSITNEADENLNGFLRELERNGIEVYRFSRKERNRQCGHCGELNWFTAEKGVDTTFCVHLVEGALRNEFDVAVMLTGDGDMIPAIKSAQSAGKVVLAAHWDERCVSPELGELVSGFINLKKMLSKIEMLINSLKGENLAVYKALCATRGPIQMRPFCEVKEDRDGIPRHGNKVKKIIDQLEELGLIEIFESDMRRGPRAKFVRIL